MTIPSDPASDGVPRTITIPARRAQPRPDNGPRSSQHDTVRAAIESYIPDGPDYDVERNALIAWLDGAAAARYAADAVLEIEHPPPDAASKCPGCAVRHVFGAHAVVIGVLTWHSTCALKAWASLVEVMGLRLDQYKGIPETLRIAAEQDTGFQETPDEPAVSVRTLVQRNAQLLELVRDWQRLAEIWPLPASQSRWDTGPDGTRVRVLDTNPAAGAIVASGAYYKLSEVRAAAAMGASLWRGTMAPTIEQLYPVCADPLRVMRDPAASAFDRIDAAKILLDMGLDQHPLMRDDVRAAAQGELGRMRGDPEADSPRPATTTSSDDVGCDDRVAFAHGELGTERANAYRLHLRGCDPCRSGLVDTMRLDTMLSQSGPRRHAVTLSLRAPHHGAVYPPHVQVLLAVRDALIELGQADPIPRTEYGFALIRDAVRYRLGSDAVQVTGEDRGRLRVEALGVEVIW